MKKIYSTLIILVALSSHVIGQCIPDTTINALYSPNESQGLPSGQVGDPYEAVIYLNVPADTTYLTFNADVDSLVLTDVIGLPPGFTYECTPDCSFLGGDHGCILVSGLITDNADAGSYDIEAEFEFHIKFASQAITQPYTIDGYTIDIDTVPVGIQEKDYSYLNFFIEPNPVSKRSYLTYELPETGKTEIRVFSLLGAEVAKIDRLGERGRQILPIGEMATVPGVYFLSLKQGTYERSMRFIVH